MKFNSSFKFKTLSEFIRKKFQEHLHNSPPFLQYYDSLKLILTPYSFFFASALSDITVFLAHHILIIWNKQWGLDFKDQIAASYCYLLPSLIVNTSEKKGEYLCNRLAFAISMTQSKRERQFSWGDNMGSRARSLRAWILALTHTHFPGKWFNFSKSYNYPQQNRQYN